MLFAFTHHMYRPHLEYDPLALDYKLDALRLVLGGVRGRKASTISILVVSQSSS
ncbi:hypothetical protein P692DRAFT_2058354 [Suillus brevipes Sb2]|jgi:hypothetical protein|nr:hypothetical protein P692DRAFT_2058354 [Suillus brevipes Sb2]